MLTKIYSFVLNQAYADSSITAEEISTALGNQYKPSTIDEWLSSCTVLCESLTYKIGKILNADLRNKAAAIIAKERMNGITVDQIMQEYELTFEEYKRLANVANPQPIPKKNRRYSDITLNYKPTLEQCVQRAEELHKSYGVYMIDYYSDDVKNGRFKPVKQRKGWWQ